MNTKDIRKGLSGQGELNCKVTVKTKVYVVIHSTDVKK